MAEIKRSVRVGQTLHRELADLLTKKVSDPRLRGVVIQEVLVSDDLRNAKVYFRMLEGISKRKEAEAGLSSARGMLRSEMTRRLGLRVAPEIRFYYDEGADHALRMAEIFSEIRSDEAERVNPSKKTTAKKVAKKTVGQKVSKKPASTK